MLKRFISGTVALAALALLSPVQAAVNKWPPQFELTSTYFTFSYPEYLFVNTPGTFAVTGQDIDNYEDPLPEVSDGVHCAWDFDGNTQTVEATTRVNTLCDSMGTGHTNVPLSTTYQWSSVGGRTISVTLNDCGRFGLQSDDPESKTKTMMVTVADADIDTDSDNDRDIDSSDDAVEMDSPGHYVENNWDDDNSNGTADKNEYGTVANENDLAQVNLSFAPDHGLYGLQITLEASVGATKIKAWTSATKGTQIYLPKTYTIGNDVVPSQIYVEGVEPGEAVLDMVLKQSTGTEIGRDKVKFTVRNSVPLVFSNIAAYNPVALRGDTVAIKFTASEPLSGTPTVTVNNNAVAITNIGLNYTCTYQVSASEPFGEAAIRIAGTAVDGDTADVTDRQALWIVAPAATGDLQQFTYDKTGRRKTSWDSRGYTLYVYDVLGRVTKVIEPGGGRWVAYEYDGAGHRTKMTTHSDSPAFEHVTQYQYNDRGLLAKVIDQLNGETTYTYKDDGHIDTITYPNGTKAVHSYTSRGWLETLSNQKSDGTIIAEFTYSYDPDSWGKNGTRTGVVENILKPDGTRIRAQLEYGYDDRYRLLHEHRTAYNGGDPGAAYEYNFAYDNAGNRTSWEVVGGSTTNYTYDAANRMTSPGSFDYDDKGNTLIHTVGNVTTEYTWDLLGRMSQWKKTGEATQDYAYNADGMRVRVTPGGGTVVSFLLDGDDIAEEIAGSGFNSRVGLSPISEIAGTVRSIYHADGLGSISTLSDDGQQVQSPTIYDGFGSMLVGSGNLQLGYAGQYGYYTDQSRLHYLKARYYDSQVGRFLTRDPIGYQGGLNQYVYADSSPVNKLDPSGTFPYTAVKPYPGPINYDPPLPWWKRPIGPKPGIVGWLGVVLVGTCAVDVYALIVGDCGWSPSVGCAKQALKYTCDGAGPDDCQPLFSVGTVVDWYVKGCACAAYATLNSGWTP